MGEAVVICAASASWWGVLGQGNAVARTLGQYIASLHAPLDRALLSGEPASIEGKDRF